MSIKTCGEYRSITTVILEGQMLDKRAQTLPVAEGENEIVIVYEIPKASQDVADRNVESRADEVKVELQKLEQ